MNKEIEDKIYNEITKDITNTSNFKSFGIAFIAGIGRGKSTISKILANIFDMYIASNDYIRLFIEKYTSKKEINRENVQILSYRRLHSILSNNIPVIYDANGMTRFYDLENIFKNYNYKLFWIELKCSDEEAKRRVIKRTQEAREDEYSKATILNYDENMKALKNYTYPTEKIYFTIDTQKDISPQIDKLVEMIKKDISI